MPLIELQDITRTYRMGAVELCALRGVSLDVEAGELLAIMGASGSGKSTLLNILGTLDTPTAGHYRLDGQALEGLDEVARARVRGEKIGFVFQSFNLLAPLTALENVLLPSYFGGPREAETERLRRARAALDRVGIGGKSGRKPAELSGGERQRVAIARALFGQPRLILCDEPTGNLDAKTGAEVIGIFGDLVREEKLTLVVVTHEDRVSVAAGRVLRLREGKLVEERAQRIGAAS